MNDLVYSFEKKQWEQKVLPLSNELINDLDIYFDQLKLTNNLPDFKGNKAVPAIMILMEIIFSRYASLNQFNNEDACMLLYSFIDSIIGKLLKMVNLSTNNPAQKSACINGMREYFKSSIIFTWEDEINDQQKSN